MLFYSMVTLQIYFPSLLEMIGTRFPALWDSTCTHSK
jgi:hypothetical protein